MSKSEPNSSYLRKFKSIKKCRPHLGNFLNYCFKNQTCLVGWQVNGNKKFKDQRQPMTVMFHGTPCKFWETFHFKQIFYKSDINMLVSLSILNVIDRSNLLYNKALRSYSFVCMLATAGQTAGPNGLTFFRKPIGTLGVT